MQPFHLAIPVINLEEAKSFYVDIFDCKIGRTSARWIDLDLYGHQLTIHLIDKKKDKPQTNTVDGKLVPSSHFGVVLTWEDWHILSERVSKRDIEFVISPYIRFKEQRGEQATMFFYDPSGNALEFKSFKDMSCLFQKDLGESYEV